MWQARTDALLAALARRDFIDAPVALVVAHPDDETIGAGASLHLFRNLLLLHVTDGAPRHQGDAKEAGFSSGQAYAAARRAELRAALELGAPGAVTGECAGLPLSDQDASLHLASLARILSRRLQGVAAVLTHAYEGGHPDHDAVAFAVAQTGLPVIEMAGYHEAAAGGIEVGRFLPAGPETVVALHAAELARREAMLACFATQRATLAPFLGLTGERFRAAPAYDFTRPPAARVYYDRFNWGMRSPRWCALAAHALAC